MCNNTVIIIVNLNLSTKEVSCVFESHPIDNILHLKETVGLRSSIFLRVLDIKSQRFTDNYSNTARRLYLLGQYGMADVGPNMSRPLQLPRATLCIISLVKYPLMRWDTSRYCRKVELTIPCLLCSAGYLWRSLMSACEIRIIHLDDFFLSFAYTIPLCVEIEGREINASACVHMCACLQRPKRCC